MRKPVVAGLMAAAAFGVVQSAGAGREAREYVVLYEHGASTAQAREAVEDAGGRIVEENTAVGLATVRSDEGDFATDAKAERALVGAAPNEPIGQAPEQRPAQAPDVEDPAFDAERAAGAKLPKATPTEPMAGAQWDMRMIGATPEGSQAREQGAGVQVGIIDTGIEASHPDIAPNFNHELSRNFTFDLPAAPNGEEVDGPCEEDPDGSCADGPDVDDNGHGTHVAGTVGAAINEYGIAGVAPEVDLVNLRAGQDFGYFFLQPTLDALTYAGDNGIDVVNMSFYIDPWLYNCRANPDDSAAEQAQQQLIIDATQRALRYARNHGVTLVSAEGNGFTDLGKPESDATSPDYPPEAGPRERTVDNSCLTMPTEGRGVIGVTSVGPSKRKAFYSDYGVEQADVSAPGGDSRDPARPFPQNKILAPYPDAVGAAEAADPTTAPSIVEDDGNYYAWLQGTSMASPHATGVAALIVGAHGKPDRRNGGLKMDPGKVERILLETATNTPCPEPRDFHYPEDTAGTYDATCEGGRDLNGFYGDGIIDADKAVR
ncbi:MAG TPA: S8 family serine peptidase [Solirubrobacteraceae bacterium]|nr:S8 family serine peptidase [Solirubrobacteraceae bacterium]